MNPNLNFRSGIENTNLIIENINTGLVKGKIKTLKLKKNFK